MIILFSIDVVIPMKAHEAWGFIRTISDTRPDVSITPIIVTHSLPEEFMCCWVRATDSLIINRKNHFDFWKSRVPSRNTKIRFAVIYRNKIPIFSCPKKLNDYFHTLYVPLASDEVSFPIASLGFALILFVFYFLSGNSLILEMPIRWFCWNDKVA